MKTNTWHDDENEIDFQLMHAVFTGVQPVKKKLNSYRTAVVVFAVVSAVLLICFAGFS